MLRFRCSFCGEWVEGGMSFGTKHRNHCPFCLKSIHLDYKSGDRKADCRGEMIPIGLIFKKEGIDKYGKKRQGELMIVHRCKECKKISINRIAGDDKSKEILKVLENSKRLNKEIAKELKEQGIGLINEKEKEEVLKQLFGKI